MDLANLINTIVLVNLRQEATIYNLLNIIIGITLIYAINNYKEIYSKVNEIYKNGTNNKKIITLKMNYSRIADNSISNKLFGLIYKINSMNLNIKQYKEVMIDVELVESSSPYYNVNRSQLIPIVNGEKIDDDMYINIDVSEDNSFDNKRGGDEKIKVKYKEYTIEIELFCYKHNISTLKNFINTCEMDYLKFLNRNNESKSIFYSKSPNKDYDCRRIRFYRYPFTSSKTFDNLFFDGKDHIISRLDNYIKNEQKYKKLGIPHTLGFLFYGDPGCGKSSTIKAIANYLNRSIISVNMSQVNNVEMLINLFNDTEITPYEVEFNKRLYVFEEIDCYDCFRMRSNANTSDSEKERTNDFMTNLFLKNIKDQDGISKINNDKITLGEVLEILDGIIEPSDRICIFTTNYIDKIDKALLRPGRIDSIIEFKKLRKVDVQDLYEIWFNKKIPDAQIANIKDYSITQAEFGKLCFDNINNPSKIIKHLITL